jgi:glycosyltransferase involved in cell wall biosynthesis
MVNWSSGLPQSTPAYLHVSHSWGGGLERWIQDFCAADATVKNYVLKSIGSDGWAYRLELYHPPDDQPLRVWELRSPISGSCITKLDYLYVLEEIAQDLRITNILISSLIGHSFDVLETGIQTVIVCHDYYPFCPAFFIYFNRVCTECKFSDLQACLKQNPLNTHFNTNSVEWMRLRDAYVEIIQRRQIPFVAPSRSVQRNLTQLEPRFATAKFFIVPHGTDTIAHYTTDPEALRHPGKLKILVLGRLSIEKGLDLFIEIYPEIETVAEIYLLGCGEVGDRFRESKAVHIAAQRYQADELSDRVAEIAPDLCLLLSVCPETFCYTLSEAFSFNLPVLATQVGSFEDRIQDSVNGFLVPPHPAAMVQKITELAEQREQLVRVAETLRRQPSRALVEMVSAYHDLVSTVPPSHQPSTATEQALKKAHLEIAELKTSAQPIGPYQPSPNQIIQSLNLDILWYETELKKCITLKNEAEAAILSLQQQLSGLQRQLENAQQQIHEFEASKFGKLRSTWTKFKQTASFAKQKPS